MTKYFVDINGNYIGGFDGVDAPEGSIEVPYAPDSAFQIWNGTSFDPLPAEKKTILKSVVMNRIIDAGKMGTAYQLLTSNPVYFAKWFSPDRPFVNCDDPDAVTVVKVLGLDPDIILAPEE